MFCMAPVSEKPAVRHCSICHKPAVEPFTPFCSRRCADVDLHRWISGVYAVPAEDVDEEDSLEERDRGPEPHDRG
jgi:endogenous inhibitor of DNA gyrase (YacG/DUF329 family)